MSKSLGNFFTIREVLARLYDGDDETVRFFMLRTHLTAARSIQRREAWTTRVLRCARLYTALDGLEVPSTPVDWTHSRRHASFRTAILNDDFKHAGRWWPCCSNSRTSMNRTRSVATAALLKGLADTLGRSAQLPRAYLQAVHTLDEAQHRRAHCRACRGQAGARLRPGRPDPKGPARARKGWLLQARLRAPPG